MTKRLIEKRNIDMSILSDSMLGMATLVEDSLIAGGAKPGEDYSIRDLYSWAMPFALEHFKGTKGKDIRLA